MSCWSYDKSIVRGPIVEILVDGLTVQAHAGDSLAITLAVAGKVLLRHSPMQQLPRGMFCLMGVCQECVVHVDGVPTMSCSETVRENMVVQLDLIAAGLAAGWGAELAAQT